MMASVRHGQIEKKELERRLAETLIPVEPRGRFVKRLRARLVHYHGDRVFSGWMLLVVFTTAILVFVTLLRLFVRGVSRWGGLIRGLNRRRQGPAETTSVSV